MAGKVGSKGKGTERVQSLKSHRQCFQGDFDAPGSNRLGTATRRDVVGVTLQLAFATSLLPSRCIHATISFVRMLLGARHNVHAILNTSGVTKNMGAKADIRSTSYRPRIESDTFPL